MTLKAHHQMKKMVIQFNSNNNSLQFNNNKLKKVPYVKFLGVVIDDELNWEVHLDHLQLNLYLMYYLSESDLSHCYFLVQVQLSMLFRMSKTLEKWEV